MKRFGLWKSVRSIARLYDAGMGMLIFVPIAFFSWFPFVSTFQTRLMFNQAFSRGLEISLILAGNNHNTGIQLYLVHALFLNVIRSMVSIKFCGVESVIFFRKPRFSVGLVSIVNTCIISINSLIFFHLTKPSRIEIQHCLLLIVQNLFS